MEGALINIKVMKTYVYLLLLMVPLASSTTHAAQKKKTKSQPAAAPAEVVTENIKDPMDSATAESDPNEGFLANPSGTEGGRQPSSESTETSTETPSDSSSSDWSNSREAIGIEGNSGSAETDEAEQEDD